MVKRIIDVVLAIVGLVMVAPLLAILALAVLAASGWPVLFTQERIGCDGRSFRMRKFRSMRDAYDDLGEPLPDGERVTRIGRFLRRTRLDELPELWLILTGTMSFVGPRPLLARVVAAQSPDLAKVREAVRPGLTGLAQVSGNTLLNDREKFAVDALYVATNNVGVDLQIMMRTIHVIINGERRDESVIKKAMANADRIDRRG